MSNIIRFGIDLAKNSFAVCGVDATGRVVLRKTLNRARILEFFANTPSALVAPYHHQGRTGNNDLNDAVTVCEAAGRPSMRFVPSKTVDQQAILLIHRLRRNCVAEHTRTIGNGHDFKNTRQFAAWVGLTPRQYSTGGKLRLGRISRRGDIYLRTLLVHGARSELRYTAGRHDAKSLWAESLKANESWNEAAVALTNKYARIAWALLAKHQQQLPA